MEKVLTPSVGTKLKLNVHADVGSGLHMSDVEFECMFYTNNASRRSLTVKKSEMAKVDDDNYIAVVGPKGEDVKLGYYGEKVVLLAQTLGLNTCWVGLSYKKQPDQYQILDGESLIAVIALGYGATEGTAHPQKKGIEHFCHVEGAMPEWFRRGMEAALLAPTAVNQQKFEFILHEGNRVEAKAKFTFIGYAALDLGIVKCHFEIGAGKENFSWV